jgi:hypothetical protein
MKRAYYIGLDVHKGASINIPTKDDEGARPALISRMISNEPNNRCLISCCVMNPDMTFGVTAKRTRIKIFSSNNLKIERNNLN